jgi:hypothetical protein
VDRFGAGVFRAFISFHVSLARAHLLAYLRVMAFTGLLVDKGPAGLSTSVTSLNESDLPPGEVLIRVTHSTLNYKDALGILNRAPVIRRFPMVAGIHLLGDRCAIGAAGSDLFANVIGRPSFEGEQVIWLNTSNQTFSTNTYLGDGSWDVVPGLNVRDAAFFHVLVVPIPLNCTLEGANLIMSWSEPGFSLATGTNVNGPTNILSFTSPYTNSVAEPERCFRLIWH